MDIMAVIGGDVARRWRLSEAGGCAATNCARDASKWRGVGGRGRGGKQQEKAGLISDSDGGGGGGGDDDDDDEQTSAIGDRGVRRPAMRDDIPAERLNFFQDGKRRIDFVIFYIDEKLAEAKRGSGHRLRHHKPQQQQTPTDKQASGDKLEQKQHDLDEARAQRAFFEQNLHDEGLEFERERRRENSTRTTVVIKVHAPWTVLCRWAEKLKIKMPLRLLDKFELTEKTRNEHASKHTEKQFGWTNAARMPDMSSLSRNNFVTMPFDVKHADRFAINDRDTFFTPTQRIEIVWEILQRARNDPEDEKRRGIELLLEEGVYDCAFPLHDGSYKTPSGTADADMGNRQRLKKIWAAWGCLFKKQPLEMIRGYLGEKIAFYYAFMGFYTYWLCLPALAGTLNLVYGFFYTADDQIVHDMCEEHSAAGQLIACPICQPPACHFEAVADLCFTSTWDYRMDNEATLFTAILTVIWATVFLKAWKRQEAQLACEWDTYDMQHSEGVIRPEYEERAPARHHNFVTRELEPYVPKKTKLWLLTLSTCVTLFILTLVVAALACLVVARIALYGVLQRLHVPGHVELARFLIHVVIFIVVQIFDSIYEKVAEKLTSMECPRTQEQWLSSFLWKTFLFELLNDFVPLAYAAWVKGRGLTTPLDLGVYTEMCEPGGCLSEVTELVTVLLVARLVFGNMMEIFFPLIQHFLSRSCSAWRRRLHRSTGPTEEEEPPEDYSTQWMNDFHLVELDLDGVAMEYMEMMVQFAFCTLFVPALPVAPLLCFVNNLLEIRVDSIKFITSHRRPRPVRVPGIEIWNDFMNIIAKLAVISNAGLIAFTSDIVPRLYYMYTKKDGATYFGYHVDSLSRLPSEYWPHDIREELKDRNVTECVYNDYRHAHSPFTVTQDWWEMMCVRCVTFGVFIVGGFTFQFLYNFMISDVPVQVTMKKRRKQYVLTKGLEQAAAMKAHAHARYMKDGLGHHSTSDNSNARFLSPSSSYRKSGREASSVEELH